MEPLSIYELVEFPTIVPLFKWRARYDPDSSDEEFINQLLYIGRKPGNNRLPHNGAFTIPGDYTTAYTISPNVEIGILRIRLPWSLDPTSISTAQRPRPLVYLPCLLAEDDPSALYGLPATTLPQAQQSCQELRDWIAEGQQAARDR